MNHNNGHPCKILLKCNGGTHISVVTNSYRIGLINRWEFIPSITNIANYLELVRSWVLEECVLPPLHWASIIPNCIQIRIAIPTDKCNSHLSAKLLFEAHGNHHRKPQLVQIYRTTNHSMLGPSEWRDW